MAIMPDPFGRDNLRVLRWLVESVRNEWALPDEYFEAIRASIALVESYPGNRLPDEMRRKLSGGDHWGLPAAATSIYKARKDLQRIFSDPSKKDRVPFLLWLLTFGRFEHYLSTETIGTLEREWRDALSGLPAAQALMFRAKYTAMRAVMLRREQRRTAEQRRAARGVQAHALAKPRSGDMGVLQGVNLVGYARAEMGVGESVRAAAKAARAAGLQTALLGVEAHPLYRAADTSGGELSSSLPFPVTVFHVNADETLSVLAELGDRLAPTRHKVGFWAWELETFPDRWLNSLEQVDEVWSPSDFCRRTIAEKSSKPVLRMPHAVERLPEASHSREELGVPAAGFTVLFLFDAMSVVARKNPLAAIEAFRRAFDDSDNVRLVLKVSHSESSQDSLRAIRQAAAGGRVTIIDRVMDRAEVASLIQHADCLLSLHRSEGFGLTLAEAMSAGKTVICTGYSGNMDFTLPGSALPVDYSLVPVGPGNEPYDAASVWADPDIEHASALLRQVSMDSSLRARIGEEARKRIARDFSPETVGRMMRRRLEGIYRRLNEES
jgi:glycosyltransferase involved in cell wall biosynthesis